MVDLQAVTLSEAKGPEILRYAQNDKKQIAVGISPAVGSSTLLTALSYSKGGIMRLMPMHQRCIKKIAKMSWSTERFVSCLTLEVGENKALTFMEGCGSIPTSSNPARKAKFAKRLMDNFEKQFPADIRTKVLENCGRGCIGATVIEKARRVKKRARNLDEFVTGLNQQHIGGGKLRHKQGKIYVEYEKCYCGMVSRTKEKFSSTYCNCSRGWLFELFERVFEKPVRVRLLQSVIQGAPNCKFVIYT